MPRHRRLNLPGCIYHVITRGLESKNIFTDNYDRYEFISRLSLCYVHLNPLRAQLIKNLDHLDRYPWTGHSAIMGYQKSEWQEVDEVLERFGKKTGESRKMYKEFIKEGIGIGKRDDLLKGSLRRNLKVWNSVNLSKRGKGFQRDDERILGNEDFVDKVLKAYEEDLDHKEELKQKGWNLDRLVEEICNRLEVNPDDITMRGRNSKLSIARQLISYFGYHELGISGSELSYYLKMTRPSLSANIKKGKKYIEENGVKLIN